MYFIEVSPTFCNDNSRSLQLIHTRNNYFQHIKYEATSAPRPYVSLSSPFLQDRHMAVRTRLNMKISVNFLTKYKTSAELRFWLNIRVKGVLLVCLRGKHHKKLVPPSRITHLPNIGDLLWRLYIYG